MTKQIRLFKSENLDDLESFLIEHPGAKIISGDSFLIKKDTVKILSMRDEKNLKCVDRPSENACQTSVIYAIFNAEGSIKKGEELKTKTFMPYESEEEINMFLATHDVEQIIVVPTLEKTPPLDNYFPGEYGPIPDRKEQTVKSHKLLIVFRE